MLINCSMWGAQAPVTDLPQPSTHPNSSHGQPVFLIITIYPDCYHGANMVCFLQDLAMGTDAEGGEDQGPHESHCPHSAGCECQHLRQNHIILLYIFLKNGRDGGI